MLADHARSKVLRLALAVALAASSAAAKSPRVEVARRGNALMPILAGSAKAPAEELRRYLDAISGARFEIRQPQPGAHGLYVGLAADFPWLQLDTALGPEGYLIRSQGRDLLLVAQTSLGAQHAVSAFLESLGCRWFFPGKVWEVVPRLGTIGGAWNQHGEPAFKIQRRIWYGFGAEPRCLRDYEHWTRHNRMGGPLQVSIAHTWYGIDPKADFEKHPEWFALVDGARKPAKPCYTHPEVVQRAVGYALEQAARGAEMVSLTPPDGLGYCECPRCMASLRGATPYREMGTLFACLPDGAVLSEVSETVFQFVNQVAEAVARKYPRTLVGCLTYSAYSHPPSFKLHANVFVQTTTAFRRTHLTLDQQLEALKGLGARLGIREYFSVFQWDWDFPDPGKMTPRKLTEDLRYFAAKGVASVNAEASNNWAARGLGYYLASKLMWDVDADANALVRDFHDQAFGPAAVPMERYFNRWYRPVSGGAAKDELAASALPAGGELTDENLTAAYRDLDQAAGLVQNRPDCLARVDHLRMYAHFLFLRRRLDQAARSGNRDAVLAAIREETRFAGRLTFTNMVHARPLMGREFVRRFKKHEGALASLPELEKAGWRQIGEPPTREELERIWADDKKSLGLDRYPLPYPPRLPGGRTVVTDRSPLFLKPSRNLRPGVSIAKTSPEVDFMYYPGQDHAGGPWSVWGDGAVVGGKYYSAIGDHLSPRGTAMVYEYDAPSKTMRVLADLRVFLESAGAIPPGMDYVPAKIHTRIQMGRDGWLYYATHRGSERTCDDQHGYRGDWILRTHPGTGRTEIVAAQPVPKNSIPAGFLDPERLIFYGGTAPGPDAPNRTVQFLAYDVANRKILKVADGGFQRCAIFSESTGRLYWDGKMYDPLTNQITRGTAPAVRSATGETPQGIVYGTTDRSAEIWAFHPKTGKLEQLGSGAAGTQEYTTSIDADAGGRYLYYVPGAHGGTAQDGAPVMQFDTRTRRRKVIAFLHDFYFEKYRYHLDGTFSTALDASGETLYATWNGMREGQPRFWESCALTVIHIPASERR